MSDIALTARVASLEAEVSELRLHVTRLLHPDASRFMGSAKLTPESFDQVQLLVSQGMPQTSVARLLRLSKSTVSRVVCGHITRDQLGGSSSPEAAQALAQMVQARRAELLALGRIKSR